MSDYNVGDIVLVSNFRYQDGSQGSLHNFVIMDTNMDEFEINTLDYLCFLVSSNMTKSNSVNPNYPFNEPIMPTPENGLLKPSHVKCDVLYEEVAEEDIIMKVGTVMPAQYKKFVQLFQQSLGNLESK